MFLEDELTTLIVSLTKSRLFASFRLSHTSSPIPSPFPQESRAAAATTVDKLFNLGLTEVKEEAGDGSGLDVSARVVKTELVVLKGLDATVDDEDDDADATASQNSGMVQDHDPHDIGASSFRCNFRRQFRGDF